jgi:uncharacterized integral membrane protein (TIGR00697 family)
MNSQNPPKIPMSILAGALLYGGLCVLAGVLGTKIADLGHWPIVGNLAVESGIFAFLILVVLASATSELHGPRMANLLVRLGFVPLIVSMILLMIVIHVVPPAPFWSDQASFAHLLGQGARMQFAGLCSYGTSQTLNVAVFARLAQGRDGKMLWLRAWMASLLSQVVDTVIFITISFYGVLDLGPLMLGQVISKLILSTIMVPPLIYLFVALGKRLDAR